MKVKVPKTIRIGVYNYEIKFVDLDDYGLLGQCLTDEGLIKIAPRKPSGVTNVSFLHEVTHAVNDVYRCRIEDDNIDRIAHGIAEFLFNNLGIEFDWSDIG